MTNLKRVVGLFGTCGDSRWREDFAIPVFGTLGIEYFNPVVKDWNEEAMRREAEHASVDAVILMVITGETTAVASMAESGWIALQAYLRGQKLIMVLSDMPEEMEPRKDERGEYFRPNKTRNLLRQHISKLPPELSGTVFLCDDIRAAVKKAVELVTSL